MERGGHVEALETDELGTGCLSSTFSLLLTTVDEIYPPSRTYILK